MSTATDTDLDWSTLLSETADADSCCETRQPACSNEAVFRLTWGPDDRVDSADACRCRRRTTQCLPHGEAYSALHVNDALIRCTRCAGFMVVTSSERVRSL